jgi:hypothetical protein
MISFGIQDCGLLVFIDSHATTEGRTYGTKKLLSKVFLALLTQSRSSRADEKSGG